MDSKPRSVVEMVLLYTSVFFIVWGSITTASASSITVTTTIQDAIDQALSGDSVLVPPGSYTEDLIIDSKIIVLLGDTVSYGVLLSPTGPEMSPVSFINVASRAAELLGFTIQGSTDAPGILCSGASPTLRKNHIRDNSAPQGGGILLTDGGMALITENYIYRNFAQNGGGIGMLGGGADVIGNMIDTNRAIDLGGAVFCSAEPEHVIAENTICGNSAGNGGGGVYLFSGQAVVISGNLFVEDTSNHGGGIDNSSRDHLMVINNTFDRCVGSYNGNGGGNAIWWADGATVGGIVKNNIFSNTVGDEGGALGGDAGIVGSVEIDYNAMWNNIPVDYYRFSAGSNSLSGNPFYCDPAVGDYSLGSLSPCLGTGEGGADRGAFGLGCSVPLGGPIVYGVNVGESGDLMHVIDHSPAITWRYLDYGGIAQASFEIEVGTNADWSAAEKWDPDLFGGADTAIQYDGLALFDNETYYIRIRVSNGTNWGAWETVQFRMNGFPAKPTLVAPIDGDEVSTTTPTLVVENSEDANGDLLVYKFEVYEDESLSILIASATDIPSGFSSTAWVVDPALANENGSYWWRARAFDGYEFSFWSEEEEFILDELNEPPQPFNLLAPPNETAVGTPKPDLDWEDASDPDPGDVVTYNLILATDADFVSSTEYGHILTSHYGLPFLPVGQMFWWKIQAEDQRGGIVESSVFSFLVPQPGDVNGDQSIDPLDVVLFVEMVYRGNVPMPDGWLALDVNGDCKINVVDVVIIVNFVYRGATLPDAICPDYLAGETIRVPEDYATIQAAVDAAREGDTILVVPNTYAENVVVDNKNLVLLGDTISFGVILRPDGSGSSPLTLIDVDSRMAKILGFTIEQTSGAPGIVCSNSSPTIRKNHIRDNFAFQGGGILLMNSGMALVEENFIYRNSATDGGGIAMIGGGADVMNNVIDSNHAGSIGGGVFCDGEPAHVISDNIFRGNFANAGGGAVYTFGGEPLTVSGNLFVNDTSDHGGAIANSSRNYLMILNNTFDQCVGSHNGHGGGNAIWWAEGAIVGGIIKNNVFSNTVGDEGGAIGGDAAVVGLVEIDYNTVWNNTPVDYYRFSPGPNSLSFDPMYCDPISGDFHINSNSPCVGSGEGGANRGAFGIGCGP